MKQFSKSTLAWAALFFAAIIVLSVNLIASQRLALVNVDLTENKLYTLSDATRDMLHNIDSPITVKLYYSKKIGQAAPKYALYADRVRTMLRRYSELSQGKLIVQHIEPEPFSDEEDMALSAGLQAVNMGNQQSGYFGLIGSNSVDDREVIKFFDADRTTFLEYDLSKLILKLANPSRKRVGIISGLRMMGGRDNQGRHLQPWSAIKQLGEFYTVVPIKSSAEALPDGLDMMLMVAPDSMSEGLARAVDKFALSGKPVMVFADPFSEMRQHGKAKLEAKDNFITLLSGWGVHLDVNKVVADLSFSRRVQFGSKVAPQEANYVVWLNYPKKMLDDKDPIFANVSQLVLATAGALSKTPNATTHFQPLIQTGVDAMLIERQQMAKPDPMVLLNNYKPGKTKLTLAARLKGKVKTSWSGAGAVNVIVIGDADMLFDSFWAVRQQVLGRDVIVPRANNVDLLLNGLADLSGGGALSGLRGRGVEPRPFTLVDDLQRTAQEKFQARESQLNKKLVAAQAKLQGMQGKAKTGQVMLSEDDKKTILGVRKELLTTRKDLRKVKRALRENIDRLEFWVTFINIAAVPLLIIFGGLVLAIWRRTRRQVT